MKSQHIEMFRLTAELGSIAAAAARCGKSRSTVSTAIAAFEDELGVNLFERKGNQVVLTDIGESILPDCDRIAQLSTRIQERCLHHSTGAEASLHIVRDDALPERFWRDAINQLKRLYPLTNFSIYVAPPPELMSFINNGTVDIAFGVAFDSTINELPSFYPAVFQELGQLKFAAMAKKSHSLSQLDTVSDEDLFQYTEIALTYIEQETLKPMNYVNAHYHGLPFFEQLRDAVVDGIGWSKIPLLLVTDEIRARIKVLTYSRAISWEKYGAFSNDVGQQGKVAEKLCLLVREYLYHQSGAF